MIRAQILNTLRRFCITAINLMLDVECVFESMTGAGSIFISNFAAANDIGTLQALKIKAIISVARSGKLHHDKTDIPDYLYIPAQDTQNYQLYRHFNQTYDFIDQARKQTNVLVHCMAGVSRSVTIVMAYLLKKYKCSLSQVIKMVQRRRNKINPNKGFIEQLKIYAKQQGLKCDFYGQEVPNLNQRSVSRHRRENCVSAQKRKKIILDLDPIINKKLLTTEVNSPGLMNSQRTTTKKLFAATQYQIKQEKKSIRQQSPSIQMPESPLSKRLIKDQKQQKIGKKNSIEQKINRVRQKMKTKITDTNRMTIVRSPDFINKQNSRIQQQKSRQRTNSFMCNKKIEDYLENYNNKHLNQRNNIDKKLEYLYQNDQELIENRLDQSPRKDKEVHLDSIQRQSSRSSEKR